MSKDSNKVAKQDLLGDLRRGPSYLAEAMKDHYPARESGCLPGSFVDAVG